MEKKYQVSLFVIGILAASGVGISAWAYRGDPGKFGQNYSLARHEQMEQAFENNDYAAWKELMGNRGRAIEIITEENFSKFAEMHRLLEEEKYAEANQIREELGFGIGRRPGWKHESGIYREHRERRSFSDDN